MRIKIKKHPKISSYDKHIIRYLLLGNTVPKISIGMEKKNLRPYSISTIEKRLKYLRTSFKAKTNAHLMAKLVSQNILEII